MLTAATEQETEHELVERAKGDPSAYGELYRRNADRVYNYIFHRVGNVADAEDLTARTFYRALVGLSAYRDNGAPFGAWLFRIAHNLVANWRRDQYRHDVISLDSLDAGPVAGMAQLAAAPAADEMLAAAIRRLDSDRQALLILKSQGLTNAEIADALGRSEAAVKSLYHRTLGALRDELELGDGMAETAAMCDEDCEPDHD